MEFVTKAKICTPNAQDHMIAEDMMDETYFEQMQPFGVAISKKQKGSNSGVLAGSVRQDQLKPPRQDRRYRCAQCEELCDSEQHDGAYDCETLKPVCPSCEHSW